MAYNAPSSNPSLTGLLITSSGACPPSMKKEGAVPRNRANYCPSKWTNQFIEYSQNNAGYISDGLFSLGLEQWHQIEKLMKTEVNAKLEVLACKPLELLRMLDAVEQLGLGYLFNEEMEEGLKSLFLVNPIFDGHDLYHTSLCFRLLRQHGFHAPSSMFNRFLDEEGRLKEDIIQGGDVLSIVSFYEALQLKIDGDSSLDTALADTIHCLESMSNNIISIKLRELVTNSLKLPIHKNIPWLRARRFIDIYQEDESHDPTLLKLAKHHFNYLQRCHQQELSSIAKWWKDADIGTKLPYARNRLVESYIWSLIIYYEPQYSLARKIYTLVIAYLATLDDTYDAYGTADELKLITETIQRWDTSLFNRMPVYARSLCQILFHLYDTIEKDLAREGKPSYCLPYLKESMKKLAESYYNEYLWMKKKQMPTMEEYKQLAFASSGTTCVVLYSLSGMGDIVPKTTYDWICSNPKMIVASEIICRFQDDIISHEFEQQRDHIPSAVECYMNQYGVSHEEACNELKKDIDNAWKDINEGCLRPTMFTFPVMERILNFNRLIHVLYKDGDSFTHPTEFLNDVITSLLVDTVAI